MHLTVLDADTELAETVLSAPPRALRLVAATLLALLAGAVAWMWLTEVDLVVTATARVRAADSPVADFAAASGHEVAPAQAGQVLEVLCRDGDAVDAGQALVRLDARRAANDLERLRRQAAADQEEARRYAGVAERLGRERADAVAQARAALAEAAQALQGERERGALDERHRAASERLLAIEVERQRDHVSRLERLLERGHVPEFDVVTARFALGAAEAQLDKSRIPLNDDAARLAERRLATAEATLALVERQFAVRAEELEVQRARRAGEMEALARLIANAELDVEQSVLRAPCAAVVTACRAQPGQLAQPGQPLVWLVEGGAMRVDALVGSKDIGLIRPGMPARVKLAAFDWQRHGALDATVTHVAGDSTLLEDGAWYLVRLELASATYADGSAVKLGMLGVAEIATERERVLWLVFARVRDALGLG